MFQTQSIAASLPTLAEIEKSGESPVQIQATGRRKSLEPRVKGVLEGKARYYHPNGQLYGVIEYHNGKKVGVHTLYREDGTKEQQLSYKDDTPDGTGTCTWFDKKGEPWMEVVYQQGNVKSKRYLQQSAQERPSEVCKNLGAAVANRIVEKGKECLENKSDPNFKFGNELVLVETLTWGLPQIAELLLQAGANLEATNSRRPLTDYGSNFIGTPLGWAKEYKQDKVVALLQELGAKK